MNLERISNVNGGPYRRPFWFPRLHNLVDRLFGLTKYNQARIEELAERVALLETTRHVHHKEPK